jgi:hypothetical protein
MIDDPIHTGGHVDVFVMSTELDTLRLQVAEQGVSIGTLGDRIILLEQRLDEALHSSNLMQVRPTDLERELVDRLNNLETWRNATTIS